MSDNFAGDPPSYYSPDDYNNSLPDRSQSSVWMWVAIVEGIVIIAGIIAFLAVGVFPKMMVQSPVTVVDDYYQAINNKDYKQAATYLDDRNESFSGSWVMPNMEELKIFIQSNGGDSSNLGENLDIRFTDLEYTEVMQDRENALVHVEGNITVKLTQDHDFSVPYKWDHRMVYYEKSWHIQP